MQPGEDAVSETGSASESEVGAEPESPAESATPSTGIVIALVLGVVGLVALVAVAVGLRKRGRKNRF